MGQEFRYYQCGDYFIPDIQLSPYKHKVLGKYGRMRRVQHMNSLKAQAEEMVLAELIYS